MVEIIETKKEAKKIKTIRFVYDEEVNPGQFFMVWIPGIDEIPMSASYIGDIKGITVKEVGEATSALCKMEKGDKIGIRGPYGNGFEIFGKKHLFIGGGTGIATLAPVIEIAEKEGKDVATIIGAKEKEDLIFVDRIKKIAKTLVSTDDGSLGYKGLASDLARQLLNKEKIDLILTCGPEKMMKEIFKISYDIPLQASLERWMKCGIGICDSCSIDGMRVCIDGPVFDSNELKKMKEFGNFKREPSGKKVEI